MTVTCVPLLQKQRDLYDIPRGPKRFQAYLREMLDSRKQVMTSPLMSMNPMGREHLPARLDEWLALDADGIAARTALEAAPLLADSPGEFKFALVLADDVRGLWINRYSAEFSHRFEHEVTIKFGWIVGILWVSEAPSANIVREETLTALHRRAYVQRHGVARTLREMLAQEGAAMARAGCVSPTLPAAEIKLTRKIIAPFLDDNHRPEIMGSLFGDRAADSLGYDGLGLPDRAGLAVALFDARQAIESSDH